MDNHERSFKDVIERLDIDTAARPAFKEALRERMLAEFAKEVQADTSPRRARISWRTIMKSPFVKLTSVAAMVVVALILLLGESRSNRVWANMLEKLNALQVFTYDHEWTIEEGNHAQQIQSTVYFSEVHGQRSDTSMGDQIISQTFVPPSGNQIVQVFPASKQVMKANVTDEQIMEMRQKADPRWWLADLDDFHTIDLGRKQEDGRELIGVKIDDPAYLAFLFEEAKGELWVDVETQLPVRLEVVATSSQGRVKNHIIATGFDWHSDLDPNLFTPIIPSDYTENTATDFSDTERNALKGLRIYAELTGGKYPSNLDIMSAMREMVLAVQHQRSLDPAAEEPNNPMFPFTAAEMEKLMALRGACTFYGKLMQEESQVAYYGEHVTAHHADKVLLRWQQEDGQYRVIFGDLHMEVLSSAVLAGLEQSKSFRDLLDTPRSSLPVEAPGHCTGEKQIDHYAVQDQHAIVTTTIEQPSWPTDGFLVVRLPYKQAQLLTVTVGGREYPFNAIDARTYRIDDITTCPAQVAYTWSIAIDDMDFQGGHYRVKLQTGMPISSYQIKVNIEADGPWIYFKGTDQLTFQPFSSGMSGQPKVYFGSCGLCIEPKTSHPKVIPTP